MLAHFSEDQNGEDESANILEIIMQMDDETLRSMPVELRKQMLELDRQGVLPDPVSARIRRLFK